MTMRAIVRSLTCWSNAVGRGGAASAVFAVGLLAGVPALARDVPEDYAKPCVDFFTVGAREAWPLASTCASEMKDVWGADDPRLIALYTELADELVGVPTKAPEALPLRAAAEELALQKHGDQSLQAAEAGLAAMRTLIVAGHCTGLDPAVEARIDEVRARYDGVTDAEARTHGLRQIAIAYGDMQFYAKASTVLQELGGDLTVKDWARVARWRKALGDEVAVEAALRSGLEIADKPVDRAYMLDRLRKIYVARGDLEALSKLE